MVKKRRSVRRVRGTRGPNLWQYLAVSISMALVYVLVLRNVILNLDNPTSWIIFIAWTLFSGTIWYYMTRG